MAVRYFRVSAARRGPSSLNQPPPTSPLPRSSYPDSAAEPAVVMTFVSESISHNYGSLPGLNTETRVMDAPPPDPEPPPPPLLTCCLLAQQRVANRSSLSFSPQLPLLWETALAAFSKQTAPGTG